jgi:hypothetical protein
MDYTDYVEVNMKFMIIKAIVFLIKLFLSGKNGNLVSVY